MMRFRSLYELGYPPSNALGQVWRQATRKQQCRHPDRGRGRRDILFRKHSGKVIGYLLDAIHHAEPRLTGELLGRPRSIPVRSEAVDRFQIHSVPEISEDLVRQLREQIVKASVRGA